MVFTNGSVASMNGVLDVFREFARMSGLNINVLKSVFVAGHSKTILEAAAAEFGI